MISSDGYLSRGLAYRAGPGRSHGVGDGMPDGESPCAEGRTDSLRQPSLSSKQMHAPGEIDQQTIVPLDADKRTESAAPGRQLL